MNARNISDLVLIGVGGGGCHLVEEIVRSSDIPVRALRVDTDSSSAQESDRAPFLLLGGPRLSGHGAGGDVTKGRMAAQDDAALLSSRLDGVRTAFVVTCLGGGTGSGATGEIVQHLHGLGLTVICLATLPFSFEGKCRKDTAQYSLPQLEEEVNSLLVMPMDDLFTGADASRIPEAINAAGKKLSECVLLLWNILCKPGFITLNSQILHTLANTGGRCHASWAISSADGNRPQDILSQLENDALLCKGQALATANTMLVGIAGGNDMRLAEIGELMSAVNAKTKSGCRVEMGTVIDSSLNGTLGMTVFAFNGWDVVDNQTSEAPEGIETMIPPIPSDIPVTPSPKGRGKKARSGTKGFALSRLGQFDNTQQNIYNGVNLDFPTYYRRNIVLEK